MHKTIVYLSTTGERFQVRGLGEKTKGFVAIQNIGRFADKPSVMIMFEK